MHFITYFLAFTTRFGSYNWPSSGDSSKYFCNIQPGPVSIQNNFLNERELLSTALFVTVGAMGGANL
jgi:hypothetical protein